MKNKTKKEGKYELFRTSKNHLILTLDQVSWYAIVKGQQGEIIVESDSNHQKDKTVGRGKFYLVYFEDDPEFRDIPHLLLQKQDDEFEEWILPNGLPAGSNKKVKVIRTDSVVGKGKLMEHIRNKGGSTSKRREIESLTTKNRINLYRIAKKHGIKGRSKMDREELIRELEDKL